MKKLLTLCLLSCLLYACGGEETSSTNDATQNESEVSNEESSEATKESVAEEEEEFYEDIEPVKEDGATTVGRGYITGTFLEVEQGDYFYLVIQPKVGEPFSVRVLQTDETYEKLEANPDSYKGKPIKLYWKKTKRYIEEAGGEIEGEEYVKAELL